MQFAQIGKGLFGLESQIFFKHGQESYVLGSKLPFFSYGRDGHQPYSMGLYAHYKDSLLKVGWPSPM